MTRTEEEKSIRQQLWNTPAILKKSVELFFENMPKWLLLGLVIVFPLVFVSQLVLTSLPQLDFQKIADAAASQDLEALTEVDWSPYLYQILVEGALHYS